jgi:hypothetical protein
MTPKQIVEEMTVAAVIRSFVRMAGSRSDERKARWAHVMDATTHGSGVAQEFCRIAGMDPDQEIGGPRCRVCCIYLETVCPECERLVCDECDEFENGACRDCRDDGEGC